MNTKRPAGPQRFGDLRGMLQYVPQFRNQTFVVAIDGSVAAGENLSNILLDIAALRMLSIEIVIVLGASWQVRRLSEQRNVSISNDDGSGPTDDVTLEVSLDAITRLTSTLMQHLTTAGLRAATSNAVIAHRAGIIKGTDFMHTGRIDRIDVSSLRTLLSEGLIPIVPAIAYDGEGNTLRINSDEAAAELGIRLKAGKVLYLVDFDYGFPGGPPGKRSFSISEARGFVEGEALERRLLSKMRNAIRCCDQGVSRAHFVPSSAGDAPLLAELFSNEGIGVMVFADAYHRIRGARQSDVEELLSIMRPAMDEDRLLKRGRDEILERLEDFHVIEVDGNVLGCVAIHLSENGRDAELACLFIKRSHDNQGYGRELVAFAEDLARKRGADRLVALSTQAFDFFTHKCGFREAEVSLLPPKKLELWKASERKSRVVVKDLTARV